MVGVHERPVAVTERGHHAVDEIARREARPEPAAAQRRPGQPRAGLVHRRHLGHGDAVRRRPLERGRHRLELFGHHFLQQVDLGSLAHEPPLERIHQPLVVRDSEQVADEAVLARRYARAERGQARHRGARKARGQRPLRQAAEEGRDVAAGRNEVGAHPVDQQDRDPAHAVEPEADPVGLPRDAEHAEHRGNKVGEGAVAVARGDEHSARLSTASLVRRQFVGGEEHSGKPK